MKRTVIRENGSYSNTRQEPQVLTLDEAALLMRCSKAHVQNVVRGRVANLPALPCVRVGRRVLIRRESLDRWLAGIESPASDQK
jgi:excisionase family DNA binding protein